MRRVRHKAKWMFAYVSADEIAGLDLTTWIRNGDSVVGKYGSGDFEGLASDGRILGDS